MNDRFFLGGPQSIRGFEHQKLGPRLSYGGKDTSVGGDVYYAAGLSLFAPLPTLIDAPIRLHGFCNLGKLASMAGATFDSLLNQAKTPCLSVGGGLSVDFGQMRVEVNYILPVVSEGGEGPRLAFGVAAEFL
jgi:outer membrane protein insertion porin family